MQYKADMEVKITIFRQSYLEKIIGVKASKCPRSPRPAVASGDFANAACG